MDIRLQVYGQKLKLIPYGGCTEGSQRFVKLVFSMDESWNGLHTFVQFLQKDRAYHVYLDENNGAYLPPEIEKGDCLVMLYGSSETVIGTTNCITLEIGENYLVEHAEETVLSETLYQKLLGMIPKKLSDLEGDPLHRTVTDAEKEQWNAKSEGGGTSDHKKLLNRDQPDQHPMEAVSGLKEALAGKQPAGNYALKEEVPKVPGWAMEPQKPKYTAEEVGALPVGTEIPPPDLQPLTFKGAASGTYDGTAPLEVTIPEGGTSPGGGEKPWTVLDPFVVQEDIAKIDFSLPAQAKEMILTVVPYKTPASESGVVYGYAGCSETRKRTEFVAFGGAKTGEGKHYDFVRYHAVTTGGYAVGEETRQTQGAPKSAYEYPYPFKNLSVRMAGGIPYFDRISFQTWNGLIGKGTTVFVMMR